MTYFLHEYYIKKHKLVFIISQCCILHRIYTVDSSIVFSHYLERLIHSITFITKSYKQINNMSLVFHKSFFGIHTDYFKYLCEAIFYSAARMFSLINDSISIVNGWNYLAAISEYKCL